MQAIDIVVESKLKRTTRVRQLEAMFDVPAEQKSRLEWHGKIDLEGEPWNVGLIVGPSGCGKSTLLRNLFGEPKQFAWDAPSVVDDFSKKHSMQDIAAVCQAVGFNTIPAWLRRFAVLSNGEQFRVDLARRLLEAPQPIVLDEFTSVVDRQVAKIGSHAVQKYVRRQGKQFIAASCHYDVIEWLQPDWVLEPATMKFARRRLRRRPELSVSISYVPFSAWQLFSKFHYLTASLHKSARCYALFCEGQIASIAGMMHRPHPRVRDIIGCSRLVTLPDWQGLGLAMILVEKLGACYKALGKRMRTYPAHPALIGSFSKSKYWRQEKRGGDVLNSLTKGANYKSLGGRPSAVFEYCGPKHDRLDALRLIERNQRPELQGE